MPCPNCLGADHDAAGPKCYDGSEPFSEERAKYLAKVFGPLMEGPEMKPAFITLHEGGCRCLTCATVWRWEDRSTCPKCNP